MTRLAIGVLLWSVIHFIPVLAVDMKKISSTGLGSTHLKGCLP